MICQLTGKSNQSLSYHILKLQSKGIVDIVDKKKAIYKLTPLGEEVLNTITQSDHTMSDYFSCHHLIIGYDIKDYGTFRFNEKLWKTMRGNWHWQKIRVKDFQVRVQDTHTLAIICPKRYGKNPNETFDKLIEEGKDIAKTLASRYDMTLGDYRRIREGHKEKIGSNKIAELIGYWKSGGVWIDASGGSMNFEEKQDNNDIEKLLAMPDVLDNKLVPALNWLTENIEGHREILKEMHIAIQELRDAINKLGDGKK